MFLVTVLAFIVSVIAVKPAIAEEMKCDLGPSEAGKKACAAVKHLVKFAEHPAGDAAWLIENAKDAVERARLESAPNVALLQIQLPWLIAKAMAADAERHVDAVEQSGIVPSSFLDETALTIAGARKAGAEVAVLEGRFVSQLRELYELTPSDKKFDPNK